MTETMTTADELFEFLENVQEDEIEIVTGSHSLNDWHDRPALETADFLQERLPKGGKVAQATDKDDPKACWEAEQTGVDDDGYLFVRYPMLIQVEERNFRFSLVGYAHDQGLDFYIEDVEEVKRDEVGTFWRILRG